MGKIYQAFEKAGQETEKLFSGEQENEKTDNVVTAEKGDASLDENFIVDQEIDDDTSGQDLKKQSCQPVEKVAESDEKPIEKGTDDNLPADDTVDDDEVDAAIDDNDEPPPSTLDTHSDKSFDDNLSSGVRFELNKSIVTHFKPHSFEAEQFRVLKTTIMFPDEGEPPRTIMVTSTAPGEGKSFVAANLAVSLAGSIDEYVMLMDCDLRRPSLYHKFGYSSKNPGLSEYLTGKVSLEKALLKTPFEKLTILPCGRPPANPSELVSSDQMRKLISEVKSRYDDRYIILDAPPPYITAEANALAKQVDAIVIVVKTGSTKKEDLQDLIDTYGKKKILGVVKNYDKPLPLFIGKYSYGYKYKYKYNYNYRS